LSTDEYRSALYLDSLLSGVEAVNQVLKVVLPYWRSLSITWSTLASSNLDALLAARHDRKNPVDLRWVGRVIGEV